MIESPPPAASSAVAMARWIAAGFLCLSVLIMCASVATRTPWWDEGCYADPAASLTTRGWLGSTVLGEHSTFPVPEVHRYTYWIPPFYPVCVAGFFKVFGTSIFSMRAFSVCCALLALAAWYAIGKRLGGGNVIGLLTSAVLALDFVFLEAAANGRADAMVLGCGSAGLAAYLLLREKSLPWALAAGWSFCALAAYTHPFAVMFSCDLLVLIAILDWRRIRVQHLIWAVLPFVLVGAMWLAYILEAPDVFRAQFGAALLNRHSNYPSRALAVFTDLYHRYFGYYYESQTGYRRILLGALLFYCAGIAGVLLAPRLRCRLVVRAALTLAAVNYAVLALLDSRRYPHYLAAVFAPVALTGAVWLADALERRTARRWIAAGLLAISCGVSLCGHSVKILTNGYRTEFLPVVERVRPIVDRGGTIIAGAEFGFGVGFRPNVIDDVRLGANLAEPPAAIVFNRYDLLEPKPGDSEVLPGYRRVLRNPKFTLYERQSSTR